MLDMRILMLGWELPPHNSGGLGVACYQMSKALAARGASIDFIVPYSADHPGIDFMNVISVTDVSPDNIYYGAYENGTPLSADYNYGLSGMRAVQKRYGDFAEKTARENPPDAIHAHDWLTMEAGVRAKAVSNAPLIVHVHATEFDRSGELYGNPLIHEVEQHGLMMADRIIAVSHITKDIIVEKYHIPADKVEVVYNSLDPSELPPHEYDTRTYRYIEGLKEQGYTVIGTLTRLTVQKGLSYFVKAAAKALQEHDKLVFLLLGTGEQRDELISLATELGIADKFIFGGFVRGRQWRDAYHLLDVFVMSSVSEPFGLTALEAAHHDTALMISNQSGVGEVLDSVYRFNYWDVDQLAKGMVEIATDKQLQRLLKDKAREEYLRISWGDVADQCIRLYGETRCLGVRQ